MSTAGANPLSSHIIGYLRKFCTQAVQPQRPKMLLSCFGKSLRSAIFWNIVPVSPFGEDMAATRQTLHGWRNVALFPPAESVGLGLAIRVWLIRVFASLWLAVGF